MGAYAHLCRASQLIHTRTLHNENYNINNGKAMMCVVASITVTFKIDPAYLRINNMYMYVQYINIYIYIYITDIFHIC